MSDASNAADDFGAEGEDDEEYLEEDDDLVRACQQPLCYPRDSAWFQCINEVHTPHNSSQTCYAPHVAERGW